MLLLFNNNGNIYYYYLIIITNIQIFFITCKVIMRHNWRQFFAFVAELSDKIGENIFFMRQMFRQQRVLSLIFSPNAFCDKISDKHALSHIVFLFAVCSSFLTGSNNYNKLPYRSSTHIKTLLYNSFKMPFALLSLYLQLIHYLHLYLDLSLCTNKLILKK